MITLRNNKTKEAVGTLCIIISSILLYIDIGNSTWGNIAIILISIILLAASVLLLHPQIPEESRNKVMFTAIVGSLLFTLLLLFAY